MKPLTTDEISTAFEQSGYPFEFEVWKTLTEAFPGDDRPLSGHRLETGRNDGTTREVDVVMNHMIDATNRAKRMRRVSLPLLVEAKRLHDQAVFVALKVPARASEVARQRIRVGGGLPHWGLRGAGIGDSNAPTFLRLALSGLSKQPLCQQWSVVKRNAAQGKNGSIRAERSDQWSNDIEGALHVRNWQAKQVVRRAIKEWNDGAPTAFVIVVPMPVLVVDGPIYFYDVIHRSLHETDWITLVTSADTVDGVAHGTVDVMTLPGLKRFAAAFSTAKDEIKRRIRADDEEMTVVDQVAAAQRRWILKNGDSSRHRSDDEAASCLR